VTQSQNLGIKSF